MSAHLEWEDDIEEVLEDFNNRRAKLLKKIRNWSYHDTGTVRKVGKKLCESQSSNSSSGSDNDNDEESGSKEPNKSDTD